jgi:hypothetical protein
MRHCVSCAIRIGTFEDLDFHAHERVPSLKLELVDDSRRAQGVSNLWHSNHIVLGSSTAVRQGSPQPPLPNLTPPDTSKELGRTWSYGHL